MVEIGKGSRQGITKHRGCLIKINAMLLAIGCCLGFIPCEFHAIPILQMSGNKKFA